MRSRSFLTFLLLAGGLWRTGPLPAREPPATRASIDDVEKQTRATMRSIRSYSYEQKEAYQKKLKTALNRIDREMDRLKQQASHAGASARKQYEQELAELQPLRKKAHAWLEKARDATPGAWDDLKRGTGQAVDDLQRALKRAWAHYR